MSSFYGLMRAAGGPEDSALEISKLSIGTSTSKSDLPPAPPSPRKIPSSGWTSSSPVDGDDSDEDESSHRGLSPGRILTRPPGLSDDSWKRLRNRSLVSKMLELEQPFITEKMVEFLLQDGVCETFVSFISQIPEDLEDEINEPPMPPLAEGEIREEKPRPEPGDEVTPALRRSYRATMLLASDDPTDTLLKFLRQRAKPITAALFKVFWWPAKGSLHHACRVLDHLLRHEANSVLDTVGRNKSALERHIGPMLRMAEYSPVSETLLVKLLTWPSVMGMQGGGRFRQLNSATDGSFSAPYQVAPESRWKMYKSLAEWRFLVVLGSQVYSPQVSFRHASACADMLLEAVEVLSSDENGELLLQPIGHCPELLKGLIGVAVGRERVLPLEQRTGAARVVLGLLQKAVNDHVLCAPSLRPQSAMQQAPVLVPNHLCSVRTLLHEIVRGELPNIVKAVVEGPEEHSMHHKKKHSHHHHRHHGSENSLDRSRGFSTDTRSETTETKEGEELECISPSESPKAGADGHKESSAVSHPGHSVQTPFTVLRYLLVCIILEISKHDGSVTDKLPMELWHSLCAWMFEYPHNDLYQAVFFRLVLHALRCNCEDAQRLVLSKCRLVSNMIDAYTRKGPGEAVNRGMILQLCNAIRLQADTMCPSSFLPSFLGGHDSWKKFLPTLREVTLKQQQPGMGYNIPTPSRPNLDIGAFLANMHQAQQQQEEPPLMGMMVEKGGIDHGSEFARSLGFLDEIAWPTGGGDSNSLKKRKKKKKKKKKSKGGAGSETSNGIHTDSDGHSNNQDSQDMDDDDGDDPGDDDICNIEDSED